MLMPCGPSAVPTGGAGVALPAGSCRVRTIRIFLATGCSLLLARVLELLDLEEVELDRGLTTEDADEHLQLVAFGVDLVDRADELGERPIGHAHALALLEGHPVLRRLHAHVPEDLLDLGLVERDGLRAHARDVAAADEAGDARRVADDEPGVRVED